MFELNEEETLMTSSDNSVKLTTHRIIHEAGGKREQVMLEDLETYELKDRSIGAYGVLLFFFSVLTAVVLFNTIQRYNESRSLMKYIGRDDEPGLLGAFLRDPGSIIMLCILIIIHIFYKISRRYMIRIVGKYNSFEFRVKSFKNSSVRRMLDKLVEQSKLRKEKKE